jgi:beta-xylosidase
LVISGGSSLGLVCSNCGEGNAINRLSQMDLSNATTETSPLDTGGIIVSSAGLWAPTIRHHKNTFYIVCTNCERDGTKFYTRNFYITCDDIFANNWSNPIFFDFTGIDPSLFFDDDSRAYIQGSWDITHENGAGTQPSCTIKQLEVDISTGKAISPIREIWPGFAKYDSEGPHMYKKDGWYFLVIAEGGTFEHHMLSVARSRNIWGPFESYEANPILTADGKDEYVQNTGHGELFQDCEGAWWAAVLGIRNDAGRSPLGRETFLTAVTWPEDGWPKLEQPRMEFMRGASSTPLDLPVCNPQSDGPPELLYIRRPVLENYHVEEAGKTVSMKASSVHLSAFEGSPSFVGIRQRSLTCIATATLLISTTTTLSSVNAGLSVYKDSLCNASIYFDYSTRKVVFQLINKVTASSISKDTDEGLPITVTKLRFKIEGTRESYIFSYAVSGDDTENWRPLHVVDSIEMTARDFTGTVFGVYVCGDDESSTESVKFQDFHQIKTSE